MTDVEKGGWRRLVRAQAGEIKPVLLAFGWFFFVLACYYVLRPVRDEMGIRSGVKNLPWLFTGTFVASLIIAPIYAALVARLKRSIFIPSVYGFLILNIVAFWALLSRVMTGEWRWLRHAAIALCAMALLTAVDDVLDNFL